MSGEKGGGTEDGHHKNIPRDNEILPFLFLSPAHTPFFHGVVFVETYSFYFYYSVSFLWGMGGGGTFSSKRRHAILTVQGQPRFGMGRAVFLSFFSIAGDYTTAKWGTEWAFRVWENRK